MREYETVFLTRPDASESELADLHRRLESIITKHNGTLLFKKDWGKREMAYPIRKYRQAVYHHYDYAADTGAIRDIERSLKLSDTVIRFLTVLISNDVDVEQRKKELADGGVKLETASSVLEDAVESSDFTSADAAAPAGDVSVNVEPEVSALQTEEVKDE